MNQQINFTDPTYPPPSCPHKNGDSFIFSPLSSFKGWVTDGTFTLCMFCSVYVFTCLWVYAHMETGVHLNCFPRLSPPCFWGSLSLSLELTSGARLAGHSSQHPALCFPTLGSQSSAPCLAFYVDTRGPHSGPQPARQACCLLNCLSSLWKLFVKRSIYIRLVLAANRRNTFQIQKERNWLETNVI